MPWKEIVISELKVPGTQYVTIVNLTPHRFVLDRSQTHSYQMGTFDWDDIPCGKARQNTAKYTKNPLKTWSDTGGAATYNIQGTNLKFQIRKSWNKKGDYRARTIIDLTGMGQGQREYLDPAREAPVTLVITGSSTYGFQSSIRHGPGNWMKKLYDVIKDRQVKHLVLPGSHDAGMSRISNKIKSIGTEQNTQTQGLNIYDQLRAGARVFDLRVGSVHNVLNTYDYSFWTMHVGSETADVVIGNTGESLDDVIREVNQFTAESPGEIIFFRVRYLIGIREVPAGGPIYWNNDIVNNFFNKIKGVNNRCGNLDPNVKFENQPASYFMDQNGGNGCVLFFLNGHLKNGVPVDSPADGLYTNDRMSMWENWSQGDGSDTEKLANDQAADWKTVGRSGDFQNDQFIVSQWAVGADIAKTTALTIENLAIMPTNPAIYWMGVNNMSPESFPSSMRIDYIGIVVNNQHNWDQTSAEMYTFGVGMNLYMISENCDISKRRSPLLPQAKLAKKDVAPEWNGIIYADGTVDDNPPPTLHPGGMEVLRNGTVFSNGTVVEMDIANPHLVQ